MKFRIVTVTLAVALGFWSTGAVFAQAPQEIPDLAVPGQDVDRALQSELPLQGALNDSLSQGSIAEAVAAQPPAAERGSDWMFTLRRRVSGEWPLIALGFGLLCGLFIAGWAMGSASRKRARRAYRRMARSAGGSRIQSLEEVVASVQFPGPASSSGQRLHEPATGQE